jgi:hypothetical protein
LEFVSAGGCPGCTDSLGALPEVGSTGDGDADAGSGDDSGEVFDIDSNLDPEHDFKD